MKIKFDDEKDILEEAIENINDWYSYWNDNIKRGKKAVRFCMGDQWDEVEQEDYRRLKKVRLTYNKLDSYVQQAIAEYRQDLPDIQIRPVDENVPSQIVETIEGYIRHVSYQSNSDIVYSTGLEDVLVRGSGAIQLYYKYKDNNSFDYMPGMKRIEDSTRVFFDPKAKEITKWDGDFCGVYSDYSKKEFEQKYPNIEYPESFAEPTRATFSFWWGDKEYIRVCDFYKKEYFKTKLLMLDNRQLVRTDQFKKLKEFNPDIKIIRERQIDDYSIKGYKLIKDEVLEETRWPSKYPPLIYIDGRSYNYGGLQHTKPFIENALDAQRFLNYIVSESAQILKSSHKGKYMMTKRQLANLTNQELYAWKTPELASLLVADPDKKTRQMPQPVLPTPFPNELLAIWQGADMNIESILGRYGTVKGMDSNELSGTAIFNKVTQGNLLLVPLYSNLNRVVKHIGLCLLDLMQNISYDGQIVPIIKKNNEQTMMPLDIQAMQNYEYLVEVEGGANFAMQKSQNRQILLSFAQLFGAESLPFFADLLAEGLDLPNINKIIQRINDFILDPRIKAAESGQPMPQQPPNPQMMLEQQKIQTQAQQAEADLMKANADMMDAKRKMEEVGVKKDAAMMRANAEIQKAEMDLRSSIAKSLHTSREEMLARENESLKTELARHQQMREFLQ